MPNENHTQQEESLVVVTVVSLTTDDTMKYVCSSPREAVIAAHAYSLGDMNTWNYEKKYGSMVLEGNFTIACANQAAMKE